MYTIRKSHQCRVKVDSCIPLHPQDKESRNKNYREIYRSIFVFHRDTTRQITSVVVSRLYTMEIRMNFTQKKPFEYLNESVIETVCFLLKSYTLVNKSKNDNRVRTIIYGTPLGRGFEYFTHVYIS